MSEYIRNCIEETDSVSFRENKPFPHIVKDGFLEEKFALLVQEEILAISKEKWDRYNNPFEDKLTLKDKYAMPEQTSLLFDFFYSQPFIEKLSGLCGISLSADPNRNFCGVHLFKEGSYLDVHCDAGLHPLTKKKKQLTLGLYLSKGWKEENGAELELWEGDNSGDDDAKIKTCVKKISPLFNRAVFFLNDDYSWHGVSRNVRVEKDEKRIFLTVSYLSDETTYRNKRVKAFFIQRPEDPFSMEKEELRFIRCDPERYHLIYRYGKEKVEESFIQKKKGMTEDI